MAIALIFFIQYYNYSLRVYGRRVEHPNKGSQRQAVNKVNKVVKVVKDLKTLLTLSTLSACGIKREPPVRVNRRLRVWGGYLLSRFRSTIGAAGFNFSVRNGKRWNPRAISALLFSVS